MTAEAIARLRHEVTKVNETWCEDVRTADLRALLDAHDDALVLSYIDGEPARTAAAVAAAREEQREVCASAAYRRAPGDSVLDAVRAAPLTATPLADMLADLRVRTIEQVNAARAEASRFQRMVVAAEAERDALRAQVEAARSLCARFDRGGGVLWPYEVLAAMDGAKPEPEAAALRAQVEKAEGHAEDARQFFIKERELRLAAEAETTALRAQVEATRAWVTQRVGVEGFNDMLAETAMDGAKPTTR